MDLNELISRFTQFLPIWTKDQGIVLTAQEQTLGEDLLMALGTLYLSLMFNTTPAMELPPSILAKTTPLFAPMLLNILDDIKLDSLVVETYGRQEILDSLYQALYIQFELMPKDTSL